MLKTYLRKLQHYFNPKLSCYNELENHIITKVHDCNNLNFIDYKAKLLKNPIPRPATDYTLTYDNDKVSSILSAVNHLDRLSLLKKILNIITDGCSTNREIITKCLFFTQKYFFWHFAGQPLYKNDSISDPIANLLLVSARCGASARFLVDLLLLADIKAGIMTCSAHTTAVVFQDNCWRILDTALYPPGIFPKDKEGNFLSVEQALEAPFMLDKIPSYINFNHEYINLFLELYPEVNQLTFHNIPFYELIRKPLLPSSGYFGRDFFLQQNRNPEVQILQKQFPQLIANNLIDFGWNNYHVVKTYQAPNIEVAHLPSHIDRPYILNDHVVWPIPEFYDKEKGLIYEVIISSEKSNWSYDRFPVGCTFTVQHPYTFMITKNQIPLSLVKPYGQYISVVARYKGMLNDVFSLPSEQIELL